MSQLRTIIVDDEPLARRRLRRLLREHPDVEVVSECGNGREAVEAIRRDRPDLVFLDVQMPGLDGFEVVTRAGGGPPPAVVFATAYSEHALRAFEVCALDFLLKPFDAERLARSLDRVRKQAASGAASPAELYHRLLDAVGKADARPPYVSRLLVKSGGRVVFLRTEDVDWIAAAGKYVRLYCGADYHLLRESMHDLERRLDPGRFRRIHRSAIVNLDSVRELQPLFHGEMRAILRDGTELTVSRRYRSALGG
jgi:two-component system LytT family response regulator